MAAPDSTMTQLMDLQAEMIGPAWPAIDPNERLPKRELELLTHAADHAAADHVLHLYGDVVPPRLATTRSRRIRLTTLLFYPRRDGMSRVLVEARSVGTPAIVHDYGLLAHLVRRHGLGLVVDGTDSRSFREALVALTTDADATGRDAPALSDFAARFSRERLAEAVSKPFRGEAGAPVERRRRPKTRLQIPQA